MQVAFLTVDFTGTKPLTGGESQMQVTIKSPFQSLENSAAHSVKDRISWEKHIF